MPRFVILDHDRPFPHFDLMLESDGKLRTWRLRDDPFSASGSAAEPLGDHRIAYLDYEGPVSGGRGSVRRWDCGSFEMISESPTELRLALVGTRGRGNAAMNLVDGQWRWHFYGD